ncbi:MAG: PAS domain S-box protein, partial [Rhodothermales bacterium]|nr:PAS domain S-box protein [Rhodothermales bacterium]
HAIVSVTDTKGTITYANDKFCAMSGYSKDELIGSNHRILKSGEHSPEFYRGLWRTIASGRIWHGEIKNQKKRGGYYWVTSTIVPFLGADGRPFQYVAIRTDITAEKKKEQELARAHEAAQAANTAKSEFLATMSHEIRTPMTGVIGFADLLLQEELDGKSKDLVYKIKSSTRSLLRIINDILDISKLDAGKVELEYIDFHLPSLIAEVVDFFSDDYLGEGPDPVAIQLDLPDDLPPGINMDPTRLRQVLINLIGNARKFTEAGTITVKCRLTDDGTGAPKLNFSVRDTGIGIKPEILGKLFTEFKQGDASITRKFEGTGLGLAICKKLVSLMNGEIGAASVYGKGSTFWFSLPYKAARTPVAASDDKDSPSTYFAARRPLHVLVVDDNAMTQQIVTAILNSCGHTF